MKIKGTARDRVVTIDGVRLYPGHSQKIWNHSPDGFNWGYGGSGPAQLALAILLFKLPREAAVRLHQQFKWDHVCRWPQGQDFEVEVDVMAWARSVEWTDEHIKQLLGEI